MRKIICFLILILFLACSTTKKVEEISKKAPTIKLKLSDGSPKREGLWRQNLSISDIDSDGNLDIVAPPPRGEGRPVIFLGDGNGSFKEWEEVEFPVLPFGYGGVDVADIDKNELPDMALACHSGKIFVLLQKEKGKFFDFSKGFPTPDKFSSRVVKFVDFDKDGVEEILSLDETASVKGGFDLMRLKQKVFKLKNDKWEEIPIIYKKIPSTCFGDNVESGDFNLDGKTDFAITCHNFGGKEVLFINKEDGFHTEAIEPLPDSSFLFRLRKADFNKDGREDLLYSVLSYDKSEEARANPPTAVLARVVIAFNFSDGWKVEEIFRYNAGLDMFQFRAISGGDLDGNGLVDIVALLDSGEIFIYLNEDGRNFIKAQVEGFLVRGKSYWMDIKDINKDGKEDIIIAYSFDKGGGNIDVYVNETPEKSVK